MFNIIKSRMPWALSREFFINFAESDESNILKYFHQYKIDNKEAIIITNNLINSRKAISLGPYVYREKVYEPKFKPKLPSVKESKIRIHGTEFLPKCESEYKRAPWVNSQSPVVGMVLNVNLPITHKWTTPVKVDDKWAKVKATWYSYICNKGREFIPEMVGYLTADGNVIEETKDIYDAIAKRKLIDNDDDVTEKSLEAAKILLDIAFPGMDTDAMLNKLIPKTTNTKLANALSWMIVFTTKLINNPQVYHDRLKRGRYVSGDIPALTKYDVLPEVYENPHFPNRKEVNNIIQSKRNIIEADFNIIRTRDPADRVKFQPSKQRAYKYPKVENLSKYKDVYDPIYFKENDSMYCLPRQLVLQVDTNPYTGNPIPENIKTRARQLKDLKPVSTREEIETRELTPGLFDALKEEIETLMAFEPIYCAQCNKEVMDPKFKSIYKGNKVEFCNIKCFDKHKFKDK